MLTPSHIVVKPLKSLKSFSKTRLAIVHPYMYSKIQNKVVFFLDQLKPLNTFNQHEKDDFLHTMIYECTQ